MILYMLQYVEVMGCAYKSGGMAHPNEAGFSTGLLWVSKRAIGHINYSAPLVPVSRPWISISAPLPS